MLEIQSLAAELHSSGQYWEAAKLIFAATRTHRIAKTERTKIIQSGVASLDQIEDKDKDKDMYRLESALVTQIIGGTKVGSAPWKCKWIFIFCFTSGDYVCMFYDSCDEAIHRAGEDGCGIGPRHIVQIVFCPWLLQFGGMYM